MANVNGTTVHPLGWEVTADPLKLGHDAFLTTTFRDSVYFLLGHSGNGRPQWAKRFSPGLNQPELTVRNTVLRDGSALLIWENMYHFASMNTSSSAGFTKLTPAGNVVWNKRFVAGTTAYFTRPVPTSDSGFIAGASGCISNNYVLKWDKNGDIQWTRQIGLAGTSVGQNGYTRDLCAMNDTMCKILGVLSDTTGIELFNIYESGQVSSGAVCYLTIPAVPWGTLHPTRIVKSAKDGSWYWAASYMFVAPSTSGVSQCHLILGKTDAANNILWVKRIQYADSTAMNNAPDLHALGNGDVMLINRKDSRTAMMRINATGSVVWAKKVGHAITTPPTYNEFMSGGLFLPADSTLLYAFWSQTGMWLCRMRADGSGSCVATNIPTTVTNVPFTHRSFTGDFGGWSYTMAPIPYAMTPIATTVSYDCVDTVFAPPTPTAAPALADAAHTPQAFPNPADHTISFNVGAETSELRVMLFSLDGAQVLSVASVASSGVLSMDVRSLPPGLYFYRIASKTGAHQARGTVLIAR